MVNVWALVASSLASPDDQGNNWYGWITNQFSHALLGVLIGGSVLLLGGGWYWALTLNIIVSGAIETWDLTSVPQDGWRTLRDSIQDFSFWLSGSLLAIAVYRDNLTLFSVAVGLVIGLAASGIWPRAIRAYKELREAA